MSPSPLSLPTPDKFPAFPYETPYTVQVDLMRHLYSAVESGKLVLAESPTGTGKTLSLLCATLTWLCDDKRRSRKGRLKELEDSLRTDDTPNWVFTQSLERMRDEFDKVEAEYEEHLEQIRRKEEALKKKGRARASKRPRVHDRPTINDDYDQDFLPDDHAESILDAKSATQHECTAFDIPGITISESSDSLATQTKIFYASRTHSQLSQVLEELTRLKLTQSHVGNYADRNESQVFYRPRATTLASRAHLCINDALRSRSGDLDESCRDLLQGRVEDRCPYLPRLEEESRMVEMRDQILASPKDIEDLVQAGRSAQTCPYFGSRSAVPSAELVALPYNLLLHKAARQSLEIDLTGQIVVIDEAHNLIESVLQLYSVELPLTIIRRALRQIHCYTNRFRKRLNATHSLHLRRLTLFLTALDQYGNEAIDRRKEDDGVTMNVSSFVHGMGNKAKDINLLELESYLRSSKIIRKISGFAKRLDESSGASNRTGTADNTTYPLHAVNAFLSSLTNNDKDGRVSVCLGGRLKCEIYFKYQHLNPATYFDEILNSARCVILAGGTLSPISDVVLQLFPSVSPERISVFTCGHIINPSSLQCLVLGRGPRGKDLQFSQRYDVHKLEDLGQAIFNLVNLVPRGLVVFVPSYAFLENVTAFWTKSGLLKKIQARKDVFYEPSDSQEVENVLRDYSTSVQSQAVHVASSTKGAILFAVVGAKLSEGLNFSDELARAVVIVGLPFPNIYSSELKERMNYITELNSKRQCDIDSPFRNAGAELYENLCMRAVNQSIGRAIRHRNDWSALILIDNRYAQDKIRRKLPAWINEKLSVTQTFGQAVRILADFYRARRS